MFYNCASSHSPEQPRKPHNFQSQDQVFFPSLGWNSKLGWAIDRKLSARVNFSSGVELAALVVLSFELQVSDDQPPATKILIASSFAWPFVFSFPFTTGQWEKMQGIWLGLCSSLFSFFYNKMNFKPKNHHHNIKM